MIGRATRMGFIVTGCTVPLPQQTGMADCRRCHLVARGMSSAVKGGDLRVSRPRITNLAAPLLLLDNITIATQYYRRD